jgi:hypothetical protein
MPIAEGPVVDEGDSAYLLVGNLHEFGLHDDEMLATSEFVFDLDLGYDDPYSIYNTIETNLCYLDFFQDQIRAGIVLQLHVLGQESIRIRARTGEEDGT